MTHFYKNQRTAEIKAGITVFIAVIILFFSYAWLRDIFVSSEYKKINILFDHSGGIDPGDRVTLNGVEVGKVKKITLSEKGVCISAWVKIPFPLREGTVFVSEESNMMGEKRIAVYPSETGKISSDDFVYEGTAAGGIADLVKKFSDIVDKAGVLFDGEHSADKVFADFHSVSDSIKVFINSINNLISENKEELTETLTSLSSVSSELSEIIGENKGNINETFVKTKEIADKLDREIDKASQIMSQIAEISDEIKSGDGSANKFIYDPQLYEDLRNSVNSLDSLLKDVKKNPKKYLELKVF